jgi:heme-degrading monooxygenase HmoA
MKKNVVLALLLGALVFTPALLAQQTVTVPPLSAFPDLIGGLQKTPGCLGVETARTASGKQVIFAWFENKKAVMNWYYSDTHLAAMSLTGSQPNSHPMAGVPDDDAPVLAVASITLATSPTDTKNPMALSQIAIELYRPLPGGIAVGGRFAPTSMKVPGLVDLPMTSPAGK